MDVEFLLIENSKLFAELVISCHKSFCHLKTIIALIVPQTDS